MKKAFLASTLLALVLSCGGGTGSSYDKGFKIQPGDLSQFTVSPNKNYSTSITNGDCTIGPDAGCHAIIFNATIDGTPVAGFAISSDPLANNSFYLQVYFPSSGVPASFPFNAATSGHIARLRTGSTTWNPGTGTITFNFADQTDGTYIITASGGPINFGSENLDATLSIRAQKY